ncbi:MAG: saccharopine dehydrogenase family protein [Candidatus Bathyarchaeota archaeon]|nr:saccharopine dehydrogenase family protein [Candidatus Bathyarchaeota archaeon]
MKILVLGYGNIGKLIAADLSDSIPSAQVTIAGRHRENIEYTVKSINREKVSGIALDAHDFNELVSTMEKFDLAIGALPGDIGYQSLKAAINARIDLVDVSYMPENPLALNNTAIEAGVTIVPDCGIAPGISNLLVGHAISKIDTIDSVKIMVGGLPETPVYPLDYTITWSPEGLIDEYMRKATIIENGKTAEVDALTGLEEIDFPKIGKLESFYTDGLRTLIHTVKGVKTMWEKTLRYPGHVQKVKLIRALGFFDSHPIEVGGVHITPRDVTTKLFKQKLQKPHIKDILAMNIEVTGKTGDTQERFIYQMLEHYDEKLNATAMARTTGYPTSIVAQLLAQEAISQTGVVPMEKLGSKINIFNKIIDGLEARQIKIHMENK